MKKHNIFIVLFSLLAFSLLNNCSDELGSTLIAPPSDTTDNGNNNPGDSYGALYFTATVATPWIIDGPVRFSNNALIADNRDQEFEEASCELSGLVDFEDSQVVSFLWQGGATDSAEYKFWVADSGKRWQPLPFFVNEAGWKVAQFAFLNGNSYPVAFKFTYQLPAGATVRVANLKGYGS